MVSRSLTRSSLLPQIDYWDAFEQEQAARQAFLKSFIGPPAPRKHSGFGSGLMHASD